MANEQNLQVTSIEQLVEFSKGTIVNLPSFSEGQPFVAKLKRPSLLIMVKTGKIPNDLLVAANELFTQGSKSIDVDDEGAMKKLFDIIDIMCESCFSEPTYQQIKDAGVELTDEQYLAIFSYCQGGVKALEPFREEPANFDNSDNVKDVQSTSVGDNANQG